MAEIITIKQVGVPVLCGQFLFDHIGDGGFAGRRQAGEPDDGRFLVLHPGAQLAADFKGLPGQVLTTVQAKINHACRHHFIADTIDQDK